jgi:hypothetical protein
MDGKVALPKDSIYDNNVVDSKWASWALESNTESNLV